MATIMSMRSTVVGSREQVSANLEGETVILDMKSGMYYGLDSVGSHIWDLIQQPITVNELRDAVLQEYEVEPEVCERDLLALLEDLTDVGLVQLYIEPNIETEH